MKAFRLEDGWIKDFAIDRIERLQPVRNDLGIGENSGRFRQANFVRGEDTLPERSILGVVFQAAILRAPQIIVGSEMMNKPQEFAGMS